MSKDAVRTKSPLNLNTLQIDVTELASMLIQLVSRQGLTPTQGGYGEVGQEIRDNHEAWGAKAGVTADDIATLDECDLVIASVDRFLPAIDHLHEVMLDTRYDADDRRQRTVLNIAKAVDRRIRKTPELETLYAKTRSYRSTTAKKALRTRRRNEAENDTGAPSGPSKASKAKTKKRPTRRSARALATKSKSPAAKNGVPAASPASDATPRQG
ncbi:MAG TPA: hypothetical protein VH877_12430 [Polyangia bacterium]|jgi:hypothetical protein|nr:hypothetical protein [Polyangia bacterium]